MSPTLGTHKRKFLFSVCAAISPHTVQLFADTFIRMAGMTPARTGRIDYYPYKGGGGEGFTAFFPLMESYLVVDVYDDLNESEILLSTCRPDRISLESLRSYIETHIGQVKEIGTL